MDNFFKRQRANRWLPWLAAVAVMIATPHPAQGQFREIDSDKIRWTWEAEADWVGRVAGGATWRVVEDDVASGDAWLLFYADRVGDFIEFTLPEMLPGRYVVQVQFKAHEERGICQLSCGAADGSGQLPLGEPIDMRATWFDQ